MKELIIGFSRPRSKWAIVSYLIRRIEKAPYSHVFIRWSTTNLDRDLVYQASHGMVHFISGDRFDESVETVHSYTIAISKELHQEVMKRCIDYSGVKYGTLQLLGMGLEKLTGLRNPFRDGTKTFVCSELVGEVLKLIYNIDIDLELAGPKELDQLIAKCIAAK